MVYREACQIYVMEVEFQIKTGRTIATNVKTGSRRKTDKISFQDILRKF